MFEKCFGIEWKFSVKDKACYRVYDVLDSCECWASVNTTKTLKDEITDECLKVFCLSSDISSHASRLFIISVRKVRSNSCLENTNPDFISWTNQVLNKMS